jgi:hypothetical protein
MNSSLILQTLNIAIDYEFICPLASLVGGTMTWGTRAAAYHARLMYNNEKLLSLEGAIPCCLREVDSPVPGGKNLRKLWNG